MQSPPSGPSGSATTRRVALVIGNAGYEHHPLKNAGHDADGIAAALTRLGFTVTTNKDLTRSNMVAAVNRWGEDLDSHTLALVYFSGHGIGFDSANYLVPIDNGGILRKRMIPDMTCSLRALVDAADDKKCPLCIFILDACSSDPYPDQDAKGAGGVSKTGLIPYSAIEGRYFAYATLFGETASDNGDGEYSLYTEALLHNIETPGLAIEQVFNRVRGEVMQRSNRRQIPEERSRLVGEFSFRTVSDRTNMRDAASSPGPASYAAGAANLSRSIATTGAAAAGAAAVSSSNTLTESRVGKAVRGRLTETKSTGANLAAEYLDRGNEAYGVGKYDVAEAFYTIAIDLAPGSARAYYSRGFTFARLGEPIKALADYRKYLELMPNAPDAGIILRRIHTIETILEK